MGNIVRKYEPSSSVLGDDVLSVNGFINIEDGGEFVIKDGGNATVKLGGELVIAEGGALKYQGYTMQPTLMKFSYDFTADGGGIGTVNLGGDLPIGAIITGGMLVVTDALTSDGAATVALHAKTANDILAAAELGTNGTAGLHDVVPDFTATNAILLDAKKDVVLTIGTAALTAGAFDLYLRVLM